MDSVTEPRTCISCGEEWKDDFWCTSKNYPNICLNCCPNAYGAAKCCDGKCEPIVTEIEIKANPKDLPF